jgi:hypothetical protein
MMWPPVEFEPRPLQDTRYADGVTDGHTIMASLSHISRFGARDHPKAIHPINQTNGKRRIIRSASNNN